MKSPGLLLTAFVLPVLVSTPASAQVLQDRFWGTNGSVLSVVSVGNVVYAGGSFDYVGPNTGSLAFLTVASGGLVVPYPRVSGDVLTIAGDGSGGWLIGGAFTSMLGQPRNGLARINASGILTSWNPNIQGQVHVLLVVGSTIYVGGHFLSIDGQSRQNIAAFDRTTGALLPWNPGSAPATATVRALAIQGSTIYAGGDFTSIGGQAHLGVAALDVNTGQASSWDAHLIGFEQIPILAPTGATSPQYYEPVNVQAIVVGAAYNAVYIGGRFEQIGGLTRPYLGAVDASNGYATAWNPVCNLDAFVMVPRYDNGPIISAIYVGGGFSQVGGQPRHAIAELDPVLGQATSWNPGVDGGVNAMTLAGGTLYAGGSFHHMGGAERTRLAALSTGTGLATSWDPGAGNVVNAIGVGTNSVLVGSKAPGIFGGVTRINGAAFDGVTGAVTGWNPSPGNPTQSLNAIWTLETDGTLIYAGGTFTSIGGQLRSHLAALDATTGNATSWDPNPDGQHIATILRDGTRVFVAGSFAHVGGKTVKNVAEVSLATGLATNWSSNPTNGSPRLVGLGNGIVYVAGEWFTIGTNNQQRRWLAALSATTGAATSWKPDPDFSVYAVCVAGGRVYVGGEFTTIAGQPRQRIAAFENDVLIDGWQPAPNDHVLYLASDGNVLYAAGWFNTVNGQPRNGGACAFDAASGALTNWSANITGGRAGSVRSGDGYLLFGGTVANVAGLPRSGLLVFSDSPATGVGQPTARFPLSLRASPNPFSNEVSIDIDLRASADVDLAVYDVAGRLVRQIHIGKLPAGTQRISWDGRGDRGNPVSTGAYFARVRAGARFANTKLILIR